MKHPRRIRQSDSGDKNSAFTVEQGLAMALVFLLFAATVQAAEPGWWTASGGPIDSKPANDYAVANEGQLKKFTQSAVLYLNANLTNGAGTNLNSMVTGWSNYYATNGYSSTNPAPGDFAAANVGQLKYIASLVYGQLSTNGYTGLYPSWIVLNTNSDYSAANLGQLKTVFDFDLSVSPGSVTNLTTVSPYPGQVSLSWTSPNPNNATAITVQRSIDGGTTWTTLTSTLDPTSFNFSDNNPSSGPDGNQYGIISTNPTGSSTTTTTSSPIVIIPSTPTNLSGTLNNSGTMSLSWAPVTGAANYVLQRKILNGSYTWTTIATPTATNYLDSSRSPYVGYRYQVSVTNSAGASAPSSEWPQSQYAVIVTGTSGTPFAVNNGSTVASTISPGVASMWTNGVSTICPTNFIAYGKGGMSTDGRIVGYVNQNVSQWGTTNQSIPAYTNTIEAPATWSTQGGVTTTATDNGTFLHNYGHNPPFPATFVETYYNGYAISPTGTGIGVATVDYLYFGGYGYPLLVYDSYSAPFTFSPLTPISTTPSTFAPVAVNNSGVSIDSGGYMTIGGTYTSLGFTTTDINNAGLVVGGTLSNGVFQNISSGGTIVLSSYEAIKVNNATPAQILDKGNQLWNYDSTSSIYRPMNLADYVPDSGWTNITFTAMNDNADIIGTGTFTTFASRSGSTTPSTQNFVVVPSKVFSVSFVNKGIPYPVVCWPITSDAIVEGGNQIYSAPQWMSGTNNHNYPVVLTRNAYPCISATFTLSNASRWSSIMFKADGSDGIAIPATTGTIDYVTDPSGSTVAMPPTVSTTTLPNTIKYYNKNDSTAFILNWQLSVDGGTTWGPIGSTKHTVYVVLGAPTTNIEEQETPFYIGCKYGNGLSTQSDLINAVWARFQGGIGGPNTLFRVGSTSPMTYYANKAKPIFTPTGLQALLDKGDGRCEEFANLMLQILYNQGVGLTDAQFIYVTPTTQYLAQAKAAFPSHYGYVPTFASFPEMDEAFFVKNWTLNTSDPFNCIPLLGIAAQGNSNPIAIFPNHAVVQITLSGTEYYDPSYGTGPYSTPLLWQQASLAGFGALFVDQSNLYSRYVFYVGSTTTSGTLNVLFTPQPYSP